MGHIENLKSSISLVMVLLGLFLFQSVEAQNFPPEKLEGRVYSEDGDVAATHVLNSTAQRATITDNNGFFSITARLNDTLVLSAVQYKRKKIVITSEFLESKLLLISLEQALTELDEVVVTPYSLSGDMAKDLSTLNTLPVVTASTLGLPNAYVKPMGKTERELFAATNNPFLSIDPLVNMMTGRKKMLKKRVARNGTYARTERVRDFYIDSLYTGELQIPQDKIDDFMYFCEVDGVFQSVVDTHDRLAIWEFMRKKSVAYLRNNQKDFK